MGSSIIQEEYSSIVKGHNGEIDNAQLANLLTTQAEWTEEGAQALIYLAQNYGSFMLRNALALANVLDIEDGALGF